MKLGIAGLPIQMSGVAEMDEFDDDVETITLAKALQATQERCNTLLAEARSARAETAEARAEAAAVRRGYLHERGRAEVYFEALQEIAACNDGEGLMPTLARRGMSKGGSAW